MAESELRNALLRRQQRSEVEGSTFERQGAPGSTSDVSWNKHKSDQFTPRELREEKAVGNVFSPVVSPGRGAPPPIPECSPDAQGRGESAAASEACCEEEGGSEWISEQDEEIENLQKCLQLERERARALEKRASEAEHIAVWLKEELDRSSERGQPSIPEVDHTRVVKREMPQQDPEEIKKVLALREELHKLQTHAAKKQEEVMALTEQSEELREELDQEKERVLVLKKQESTHKQELQKASCDIELNQWLQDEVKQLREEGAQLRVKITSANKSEQNLKEEIESLRNDRGRSVECNDDEMERLSMTVGGQLVSVERELAVKTKQVSDLAEPFLRQMHSLLEAARRACQRLDAAAPGGPRAAPALFDPRSRDLRGALRGILELLHYMVEVLGRNGGRRREAHDDGDDSVSSGPSVAPSRTVPEGSDGRGFGDREPSGKKSKHRSRDKSVIKEDDRSGWGKRWTCMLVE